MAVKAPNKVIPVGLEKYDEKQTERVVIILMGRSVGFERLLC